MKLLGAKPRESIMKQEKVSEITRLENVKTMYFTEETHLHTPKFRIANWEVEQKSEMESLDEGSLFVNSSDAEDQW